MRKTPNIRKKVKIKFPDLDYDTFRKVAKRMDDIIQDIRPSGTNGRMSEWVSAVHHMFAEMKIEEKSYVQTWWKLYGKSQTK